MFWFRRKFACSVLWISGALSQTCLRISLVRFSSGRKRVGAVDRRGVADNGVDVRGMLSKPVGCATHTLPHAYTPRVTTGWSFVLGRRTDSGDFLLFRRPGLRVAAP